MAGSWKQSGLAAKGLTEECRGGGDERHDDRRHGFSGGGLMYNGRGQEARSEILDQKSQLK